MFTHEYLSKIVPSFQGMVFQANWYVSEIKVPFSIKYFMSGARLCGMRTLERILGIDYIRDTIIIKI